MYRNESGYQRKPAVPKQNSSGRRRKDQRLSDKNDDRAKTAGEPVKPFDERQKTAEGKRTRMGLAMERSTEAISKARGSCSKANELLHESVRTRVEAERESPLKTQA